MARAVMEELTGRIVRWPPRGAGDFADVAWIVADALGNGEGVRAVEVHRHPTRTRVVVRVEDAGYVRRVAAEQGWQLLGGVDGGRYAMTCGSRAGWTFTVIWSWEPPFEVPEAPA